jgi:hypothetical protein
MRDRNECICLFVVLSRLLLVWSIKIIEEVVALIEVQFPCPFQQARLPFLLGSERAGNSPDSKEAGKTGVTLQQRWFSSMPAL